MEKSYYGMRLTIKDDVQYIGDDEDPKNNPVYQFYKSGLKDEMKSHKPIIDALYEKWGKISITLLQRRLNLAYDDAKEIHDQYMETKK